MQISFNGITRINTSPVRASKEDKDRFFDKNADSISPKERETHITIPPELVDDDYKKYLRMTDRALAPYNPNNILLYGADKTAYVNILKGIDQMEIPKNTKIPNLPKQLKQIVTTLFISQADTETNDDLHCSNE